MTIFFWDISIHSPAMRTIHDSGKAASQSSNGPGSLRANLWLGPENAMAMDLVMENIIHKILMMELIWRQGANNGFLMWWMMLRCVVSKLANMIGVFGSSVWSIQLPLHPQGWTSCTVLILNSSAMMTNRAAKFWTMGRTKTRLLPLNRAILEKVVGFELDFRGK